MVSLIVIGIAVVVIVGILLLIYFVRQPYLIYNVVKQPGYRRTTVWEGSEQVEVNVPYLLSNEDFGVDLTLVIPCYNESKRFPQCYEETHNYLTHLKEKEEINIEMVLVNDCSKDDTWDMIKQYCRTSMDDPVVKIRGVSLDPNSGKGGASRLGFLYSKGKYVLVLDADGATEISDYERLRAWMDENISSDGHCIAIGSRWLKVAGVENTVERSCLRNFVSKVFNFLRRIVIGTTVQDTQCGFKLFTRESAKLVCIPHMERWTFDTELLFIAAQKSIPVVEVPVTWREMLEETKVAVWSDSLIMLRDLFAIRLLYCCGFWSLSDSLTY